MGLLELCEKYYNTTNLYEVLQISENATDKEVKKAYHKLSLKVHPDRVSEEEKLEATEKFKVLGSIHSILTDKDKRALYDETKSVDDDDYNVIVDRDWTIYWRLLFKKITVEDIKAYEKEYVATCCYIVIPSFVWSTFLSLAFSGIPLGSKQERDDLKHAYVTGKGDMDYIVDHIQFARTEHEPRIREIINEMIKEGEIPALKAFTHEPAKKRQQRIAKENREAKEAEEMSNELGFDSEKGSNSLEVMIKQRQESRAQKIDSFIDDLAAKYGGSKAKAPKRKASAKADSTLKSKRKK